MKKNKKLLTPEEKQIDELLKKIEKELGKSEKKADMQLIDSYFEQIEELDGGKFKKTEAELTAGLNKVKEKGERIKEIIEPLTYPKADTVRRVVPMRRRIAVSFAAVFLVVALSFSVAAASLGGFGNAWFYVSNSVKEILGMNPGEKDIDGITIIKGDYTKKYDTLEELLASEQFDDIMYPSSLPDGVKIKSVTQIQLNDEQYLIIFKFNSENLGCQINNYCRSDLSFSSDYEIYKTDKMEFYITRRDDVYYSIAQYNGKEYTIDSSNYENLIYVLSNMKGYTK